ncbi:FkbM family methyltransferase [Novosphingobium bradum]|uniref:FkbM family methyltransferase n=1 Tax=Novosphingobium bradum TaxID=1737444 RepID=A0ABV7IPQ2_9SPHN
MKTFIKDCRRGRFLLIEGDMISGYVDRLGHWCDVEVDLFRSLLPERGGVCIEVGANIGMHAVPLARMCAGGKLVCYEPQRPIFHVLCANLALNNLLNVEARRAAVGRAPGRIAIETSAYDQPWNYGSFSIGSGFSTEGAYGAPVVTEGVEIVSLDSDPALEGLERVDLLKIDAEGHEMDVLEGARALIARHRPAIFVEPGGADRIDGLAALIGAMGYRGYWFVSSRYAKGDPLPKPGVLERDYDINLVFVAEGRPQPDLKPIGRAEADLAAGIPIRVSFP